MIAIDGSTPGGHSGVASMKDAAVGHADGTANEINLGAVPKTVQMLN